MFPPDKDTVVCKVKLEYIMNNIKYIRAHNVLFCLASQYFLKYV